MSRCYSNQHNIHQFTVESGNWMITERTCSLSGEPCKKKVSPFMVGMVGRGADDD